MIWTSCILAFAALPIVLAVPCTHIGYGNYGGPGGPLQRQLDPFVAGQGFDIIQSQKCLIRFQVPRVPSGATPDQFGQALNSARVTATNWATTQQQYIDTCNSYTGGFGTNAMLWLAGDAEPYQYAGILKRSNMEPQSNLAAPETQVTYLLPSGVDKVTTVSDSSSQNCQQLANAGGVGISGTVDPNVDYAYAPLFRVALGLSARYPDTRDVKLFAEDPWPSVNGAFVTADKADGSCVVIDFRSMPAYVLNIENYPNAKVNDCT